MKKKRNQYNVQGISFPSKELLEHAKMRALEEDISLSKYVNRLIKHDLATTNEDHAPYNLHHPARERNKPGS